MRGYRIIGVIAGAAIIAVEVALAVTRGLAVLIGVNLAAVLLTAAWRAGRRDG